MKNESIAHSFIEHELYCRMHGNWRTNGLGHTPAICQGKSGIYTTFGRDFFKGVNDSATRRRDDEDKDEDEDGDAMNIIGNVGQSCLKFLALEPKIQTIDLEEDLEEDDPTMPALEDAQVQFEESSNNNNDNNNAAIAEDDQLENVERKTEEPRGIYVPAEREAADSGWTAGPLPLTPSRWLKKPSKERGDFLAKQQEDFEYDPEGFDRGRTAKKTFVKKQKIRASVSYVPLKPYIEDRDICEEEEEDQQCQKCQELERLMQISPTQYERELGVLHGGG
jgi:hypothetical protein